MCGCSRQQTARRAAVRNAARSLREPSELTLVVSSTPEPIYGCVTGTRYSFDKENTLYMDIQDTGCLSKEEYSIL